MLYLAFGAAKQTESDSIASDIAFTVIVPAKDEAENIAQCLDALMNQSFSSAKYEVLVMDDSSADETAAIAEAFLQKHRNISVHHVQENKTLVGKSNAIDQGIAFAKNEIIAICDADCEPNKDWLLCLAKQFKKNINVVSGFTLLAENKVSLFGKLQNIDWIYLLGIGASAAKLAHPISCIGSNLAFRKETYFAVGGYKKIGFSITEDLALYKTMGKYNPKAFAFDILPESINWSKPMKSYKEFYKQRKRWVLGSFDLNIVGGLLLASALLAHLIPVLSAIYTGNIIALSAMIAIDSIVLYSFFSRLKQRSLVFYLPVYFLFYFFCLFFFHITLRFSVYK